MSPVRRPADRKFPERAWSLSTPWSLHGSSLMGLDRCGHSFNRITHYPHSSSTLVPGLVRESLRSRGLSIGATSPSIPLVESVLFEVTLYRRGLLATGYTFYCGVMGFSIEGPVVSLRIRDIFGLGQHSIRPNGVYRGTL